MVEIAGFAAPRLGRVKDVFAANFETGEELGARFTLVEAGEVVLDLWAGHADRTRQTPFDDRTLTPVFSTTKAIAALLMARLADQGRLAYDQPGTWSLKYNGYCDTLLGLGLVPRSVAAEEAAWYLSQANPYGVPLDIRHAYTKADWELWAAAWLHDQPVRDALIDAVYAFVHTSPSRVPFTDWYDTVTDRQVGFRARPVVGGVFALLSLEGNGGPGH